MRQPTPWCRRCMSSLAKAILDKKYDEIPPILEDLEHLNLSIDNELYDYSNMASLHQAFHNLVGNDLPLESVSIRPRFIIIRETIHEVSLIMRELQDYSRFRSIKVVDLTNVPVIDHLLSAMKEFLVGIHGRSLKALILKNTGPIVGGREAIGPGVVEILSAGHLPNLEVIHLAGSGLNEHAILQLANALALNKCPMLRQLDVGDTLKPALVRASRVVPLPQQAHPPPPAGAPEAPPPADLPAGAAS